VTLLSVDVSQQLLQSRIDFENGFEGKSLVAVLVVVERVDLVMPHESSNRQAVSLP
jgi:hypothetical protein